MELSDITPLITSYHRRLANVSLKFKRYLHSDINWNASIIGIKGAKGTGKTTMLLQRIKEKYANPDDTIYFSLDDLWFKTHDFLELIDYLFTHGITELYIDEVHKYEDWGRTLKNICDNYKGIRIVYTGSSMLKIDQYKSDLARRQTLYTLNAMSFREFLEYNEVLTLPVLSLDEILANHVKISMDICSKVKILKHFGEYLNHGCYPYFKEEENDFLLRLRSTTSEVIETDLPAVSDVSYSTVEKTKKLFMIVAENVPFQPNISNLATSLDATRDTCLKMLYLLDSANLLRLLTVELKSYKKLQKPEKIYLSDTNLMYAFSNNADAGTIRETFFANQLEATHQIQYTGTGDFLVDGKYTFEVGGAGKDFSQIADIPDSFLAVDVETGTGNRIPLWLLGLMY